MAQNIEIGKNMKHLLKANGFTLIELIVVMTISALLLTIAYPNYMQNLQKSKEMILQQDLFVLREAIDQFYADHGQYPQNLEDLVITQYIKRIPKDPITEQNEWNLVDATEENGIEDIKSTSTEKAKDGSFYADW